jgi:hypothetical protein
VDTTNTAESTNDGSLASSTVYEKILRLAEERFDTIFSIPETQNIDKKTWVMGYAQCATDSFMILKGLI